ncbi:MAG: hypothetical protein AMXMBFR20_19810 [Planctomycetia bacterium]
MGFQPVRTYAYPRFSTTPELQSGQSRLHHRPSPTSLLLLILILISPSSRSVVPPSACPPKPAQTHPLRASAEQE